MSGPWLSVLVPTYNGAAYLGQALNSIAAQDTADLEIIAIDDGSTDATLTILSDYSQSLPLRVIEPRWQLGGEYQPWPRACPRRVGVFLAPGRSLEAR